MRNLQVNSHEKGAQSHQLDSKGRGLQSLQIDSLAKGSQNRQFDSLGKESQSLQFDLLGKGFPSLKVSSLSKRFQDLQVIEELTLEFSPGQIHCLFGPSGCGKTTFLQLMCGLLIPDGGEIRGIENSSFSYVFQEDRLLPWSTVKENILFVLKGLPLSNQERMERVEKYLALVGLEDFQDYYPGQLSGGMKQRAAIARAFAYGGDILVLDEPFKGLDFERKKGLMDYILSYLNRELELNKDSDLYPDLDLNRGSNFVKDFHLMNDSVLDEDLVKVLDSSKNPYFDKELGSSKGLTVNEDANLCKGSDKGGNSLLSTELNPKACFFVTHDVEEALYLADQIHVFTGPPLTRVHQLTIEVPQRERTRQPLKMEQYKRILVGAPSVKGE